MDWSPRESLHRVGWSSVAVMIMTATHTSIFEFRLFAASVGLINTIKTSSVQFIFTQYHIMVHEVHEEYIHVTYLLNIYSVQYSSIGQEGKWGEQTV